MKLDIQSLIKVLDVSVTKNGVVPLTNLYLRNILVLAAKQQVIDEEKEEKFQDDITNEVNGRDW